MAHAQHTARALLEADSLDAFVTSYAWRSDGCMSSLLAWAPPAMAQRFVRQLKRRSIEQVPVALLRTHPMWEFARSAAVALAPGPILADMIWDRQIHSFDQLVARRYVPKTKAVQCFEYSALASFRSAKQHGVARILHLPSLDSRQFDEIQRREKARWPELVGPHDPYFEARFEQRYQRRRQEIELADVIIANSSLTARSHISAGADPSKVFAVPLGAPPTIKTVDGQRRRIADPLRVMWAGSFSLGKGAHYLLKAWKQLAAGKTAQLDIYGKELLPQRLRASQTDGLVFHGSVPQSVLFEAYELADVLIFPTLSDGFGMVVAEAFAHGLPVITTDQAGSTDLVTADNGLVVPAADPKALVDALRWCLDNRERLIEMRAYALAAAQFRQWSHFRSDLIVALSDGLSKRGYKPEYALSS